MQDQTVIDSDQKISDPPGSARPGKQSSLQNSSG
eukprot:CAMPEP_0174903722 /NCGR_PEP_ID=MMETSP0167-20121228/45145_1 /TAXON_ID=38298 /ORGANISM="Rhodella maculata, Strain CCMP736" /LENGTH=33 /DNA_ID= /DNA_START= /DNA_END= /DNA_ORIENTATION=